MSGPESSVRKRVLELLHNAGLHAIAVENSVDPGTPDVNYGGRVHPDIALSAFANGTPPLPLLVEGWIELKALDRWPARSSTAFQIRKFTPQQRMWLRRRRAFGLRAHLLVRIGRTSTADWLLLDGAFAAKNVGKLPTEGFANGDNGRLWQGGPPTSDQLVVALCQPCP